MAPSKRHVYQCPCHRQPISVSNRQPSRRRLARTEPVEHSPRLVPCDVLIHPACETLSRDVVLVVVAQDVIVCGGRDCHLCHVQLVGSSRHEQRHAVAEAYLRHLADSARSLDDAHIKSPLSVLSRCRVPTYFAESFSENLMVDFDEGHLCRIDAMKRFNC